MVTKSLTYFGDNKKAPQAFLNHANLRGPHPWLPDPPKEIMILSRDDGGS